jgi:hypothetical protein
VVLADQIKQVEDHHLVELIATIHKTPADDRTQAQPLTLAIPTLAVGASEKAREHSKHLLPMTHLAGTELASLSVNPIAERHGDTEDYLWGV